MTEEEKPPKAQVLNITEARERRFFAELEAGKYPALDAGSRPIKQLGAWMEDNGQEFSSIVAMFVYTVAAEYFRRDPDDAERSLRQLFDHVLADLRDNGPEEEEEWPNNEQEGI
jgi:hypothetical protein